MPLRRLLFAVLLSIHSAALAAGALHVPQSLLRHAQPWATVPPAAASLIDWLLGTRITEPENVSALIAQERRVCIRRFERNLCWDPAKATPAERHAATELACRSLRLRHDEKEAEIRGEHDADTEHPPTLSPASQEAMLSLRFRTGRILRDGGVPMNDLEQTFRLGLANATHATTWPPEAVASFEQARRALSSVEPLYRSVFEETQKLLLRFRDANGRIPTSEGFERGGNVRLQGRSGEPHRLGTLEQQVCNSAAARFRLRRGCPTRRLESLLAERLRTEAGMEGAEVSFFVHGRTPLGPDTFDSNRYHHGQPQPFRLDLDRFDPELQIRTAAGQRLNFRLVEDLGAESGWRLVPVSYAPDVKRSVELSQTVKPFAQLTERQVACLAGWNGAHQLPPPPSAPTGMPSIAALRAQHVRVFPLETLRHEDGREGLRTRFGIYGNIHPAYDGLADMIPIEEFPLGAFFAPAPPAPSSIDR